jgi:hypothetical protein
MPAAVAGIPLMAHNVHEKRHILLENFFCCAEGEQHRSYSVGQKGRGYLFLRDKHLKFLVRLKEGEPLTS